MDARDFFLRYTRLQPIGYRSIGIGMCPCQTAKPTGLYRRGTTTQCAVCICLRQNYDVPGKKPIRMGVGSYMFVSSTRLRYWGNHDLTIYNPAFECTPAKGQIMDAIRTLIVSPPEPPWMFIAWSASTSANQLVVTRDPAFLRFGGKLIISRAEIGDLNRDQVMRMRAVGLSRVQWDTYFDAYVRGSETDIEIMRNLETLYPVLAGDAFRFLPPKDSAEYVVLRWLLGDRRDQ